MPPRRSKKGAKRPARRTARKAKASYPDSHNFKFLGPDTRLLNFKDGGGAVSVRATGGIFLGAPESTEVPNLFNYAGSFAFTASQSNQWSQMSTLFDRYRINKITVRVIPQQNVAETAGSGNIPTMRVVRDYDDNSNPSVGDVLCRRGTTYRLDKPFTLSLVPKTLALVWGAAGGQAFSPQAAPYIDVARGDVPHFGMKWCIRDWPLNSTPNVMVVRFEITYHITFKNQIRISAPNTSTETGPDTEEGQDLPCEDKVMG